MAQLTPEDRARLDTFKAVTVKHAHLQAVDDQLSLWVEAPRRMRTGWGKVR